MTDTIARGASKTGIRAASCTCGQLRLELEGDLLGVGLCHCFACQRRTGSAFAALASFSRPFSVIGQASEFQRAGENGTQFKFRFCPVCGTNLFHTQIGDDAAVDVAVGAFADPQFPAPEVSSYDDLRHAWVGLASSVRRFARDAP